MLCACLPTRVTNVVCPFRRVKEEELAQLQYLLDPIGHISPIRGQAEEAVLAVVCDCMHGFSLHVMMW